MKPSRYSLMHSKIILVKFMTVGSTQVPSNYGTQVLRYLDRHPLLAFISDSQYYQMSRRSSSAETAIKSLSRRQSSLAPLVRWTTLMISLLFGGARGETSPDIIRLRIVLESSFRHHETLISKHHRDTCEILIICGSTCVHGQYNG